MDSCSKKYFHLGYVVYLGQVSSIFSDKKMKGKKNLRRKTQRRRERAKKKKLSSLESNRGGMIEWSFQTTSESLVPGHMMDMALKPMA